MEVKGAVIKSIPEFIGEKLGQEAYDLWLESISEQARKVYSDAVYPAFWYPVKEALIEPTKVICDIFYNGDLRGAWESGRFSADYSLKGIYKVFIKFGSFEYTLKKSSVILSTYYKPSELQIIDGDNGYAVFDMKFEESSSFLDHRLAGWIERTMELCGVTDINVEIIKPSSEEDPHAQIQILWK
ncbi:hypothetical protein ACFLUV_00750 [Elusimicrobiota bacterium]